MIDRGMLKWQPFEALEGQNSFIKKMKHRKYATTMPVLSSDQLEELNTKMLFYFESNLPVKIKYFKDGYFEYLEGIITKLDYYNKQLYINIVKKIKVNIIVEITAQNWNNKLKKLIFSNYESLL